MFVVFLSTSMCKKVECPAPSSVTVAHLGSTPPLSLIQESGRDHLRVQAAAQPVAAQPDPLGGTALQGMLRASYSEDQQWSAKWLEFVVMVFRGCGDICHVIPYQLEDRERNE